MTQIDFIEKSRLFIELAKRRATGTPKELSAKLNIQERALYRLLDSLRTSGLGFTYSRTSKSYYLDENQSINQSINQSTD